jgi:hypothetical protein
LSGDEHAGCSQESLQGSTVFGCEANLSSRPNGCLANVRSTIVQSLRSTVCTKESSACFPKRFTVRTRPVLGNPAKESPAVVRQSAILQQDLGSGRVQSSGISYLVVGAAPKLSSHFTPFMSRTPHLVVGAAPKPPNFHGSLCHRHPPVLVRVPAIRIQELR